VKVIKSIKKLTELLRKYKREGKTVGFVPTMGYFHEGHISLMKASKRECDITVLSIFVNPIQFGPKEDLKKYPRNLKRDFKMARSVGVDIVFYPSVRDMYPSHYLTCVGVEKLGDVLCGAFRPGHFRGVTTVVSKLFNIIQPDIAYFGQKDAQQAIIIKKMVEDLNMPLKVKVMPVVREKDKLAMSSRNVYLSPSERKDAGVLFFSLQQCVDMIKSGVRESSIIRRGIKRIIGRKKSARIEYVEIVNPVTLEPLKRVEKEALIAIAVRIGKTRLIDNIKVRC
jgi:pantoate--beta-alanine ligase